MCLCITCQGGARPREKTLETAARTNGDGGGVAWIERNPEEYDHPIVKFEKGLDVEDVKRLSENVPHPYIVHFRKASAGESTDNLTHPFPIGPLARDVVSSEDLDYPLKRVLFQNGTATDWEDIYRQFVASRPVTQVPPFGTDNMSDTRALAYITYHASQHAEGQRPRLMAENLIQLFDSRSRFAILDADGIENEDVPSLRILGTWYYSRKVDSREEAAIPHEPDGFNCIYEGGLLFSNQSWKRTSTTT